MHFATHFTWKPIRLKHSLLTLPDKAYYQLPDKGLKYETKQSTLTFTHGHSRFFPS